MAALSWLEFCKLWKDYMTALRDGLAEVSAFAAAHPGAECPAAKRLARLVYETGGFCLPLLTSPPERCITGRRPKLLQVVNTASASLSTAIPGA